MKCPVCGAELPEKPELRDHKPTPGGRYYDAACLRIGGTVWDVRDDRKDSDVSWSPTGARVAHSGAAN